MQAAVATDPPIRFQSGDFETADGVRLFERSWEPRNLRSAVIIVHGLAEHCGRYDHLARHLAERRHGVYAFDLRGHGRSEGSRAFVDHFEMLLDDLAAFVRRVKTRIPDVPVFLMGHSMGGAVATLFAVDRRPGLSGFILSSPAVHLGDDVPGFLKALSKWLGRYTPHLPTIPIDRSHVSRDPEVVSQAEEDPLNYHGRIPARTGSELVEATTRIQRRMEHLTQPVMILHGTGDRIVDPSGSLELYRRAFSRDKTLSLYEGLYHETFNEPERHQVLSDVSEWLEEHVG